MLYGPTIGRGQWCALPHGRLSTAFLAALMAVPLSGAAIIATAQPALAIGEPDPPTALVATRGRHERFGRVHSGSDNGNPITRFDVTCTSTDGGNPGAAFDAASPIVVRYFDERQDVHVHRDRDERHRARAPPHRLRRTPSFPRRCPAPRPRLSRHVATPRCRSRSRPADNGGTAVTQFDVACDLVRPRCAGCRDWHGQPDHRHGIGQRQDLHLHRLRDQRGRYGRAVRAIGHRHSCDGSGRADHRHRHRRRHHGNRHVHPER